MSSSDPDSQIDFLDPPDAVWCKINKVFCEEGNVADNGVLAFVEAILIPISELRLERVARKANDGGTGSDGGDEQKPFASESAPPDTVFSVHRDEKYGGSMHFSIYDVLRDAFEKRDVHDASEGSQGSSGRRDRQTSWARPETVRGKQGVAGGHRAGISLSCSRKEEKGACGHPIADRSSTEKSQCRRKCITLHQERERTRSHQIQAELLVLYKSSDVRYQSY